MRCIETITIRSYGTHPSRINYNMRCIETLRIGRRMLFFAINYNMRCIETAKKVEKEEKESEINYNMRCIETCMSQSAFQTAYR